MILQQSTADWLAHSRQIKLRSVSQKRPVNQTASVAKTVKSYEVLCHCSQANIKCHCCHQNLLWISVLRFMKSLSKRISKILLKRNPVNIRKRSITWRISSQMRVDECMSKVQTGPKFPAQSALPRLGFSARVETRQLLFSDKAICDLNSGKIILKSCNVQTVYNIRPDWTFFHILKSEVKFSPGLQ